MVIPQKFLCPAGVLLQSVNLLPAAMRSFLFLDFFWECFEQLIFQTIFLILEVTAQNFQFCHLHVQIHLFPDARVACTRALISA